MKYINERTGLLIVLIILVVHGIYIFPSTMFIGMLDFLFAWLCFEELKERIATHQLNKFKELIEEE